MKEFTKITTVENWSVFENDLKQNEEKCDLNQACDSSVVGETGIGHVFKAMVTKEHLFNDFIPDVCNCLLSTFDDCIACGIPYQQYLGHNIIIADKNDECSSAIDSIPEMVKGTSIEESEEHLQALILEIGESIARAEILKSDDIENYLFEISTSIRLANHATFFNFSTAVFVCLFKLVPGNTSVINDDMQSVIEQIFIKWGKIFERFSTEIDNQVIILRALQKSCLVFAVESGSKSGQCILFLHAFRTLYYDCEDIIDDESIEKWMEQRNPTQNETLEKLLLSTIEEMNEDSDDDDLET